MKFKIKLCILLGSIYLSIFDIKASEIVSPKNVTPLPNEIIINPGICHLSKEITYSIKGGNSTLSSYLLNCNFNFKQSSRHSNANVTFFIKNNKKDKLHVWSDESYTLRITPRQIRIESASDAGAFYAIQTLLQMVSQSQDIQCCTISDSPSYKWRGLLFDVSRHFRPKTFLLKQLDAMAFLKLNVMHLHLTDAAGWRIQIDKYPKLTEVAAWRHERKWTDWNKHGNKYISRTNDAYGGYYTKEDIKEIIAYAAQRHITIIPEIELPGHSDEVLAVYPELSCSGNAYVNGDYCAGKDSTFIFLQDVLDEIIDLFPSRYIHIGGDEASKDGWRKCDSCQNRMRTLNLNSVDKLQSYFINRIENYLNQHGRQIIGWDEIMEGGLSPNATVMSWRGYEAGLKAIEEGHDAIMTPGDYCYIDYTQDAPFKEPQTIGGYTPLKKVYDYNPGSQLAVAQKEHLLGIQGNLWCEYITEDSHAEYMYYPRAFAIAETGWTQEKNKDFSAFRERAVRLCDIFKTQGYNTFDLSHEYGERPESKHPIEHIAKGCKVTYNTPYSSKWKANGESTLTDGVIGGWSYTDQRWQGTTKDMDIIVDLGAIKDIHYIGATFMHAPGPWVYAPQKVDYYVSIDGKNYKHIASIHSDIPKGYDSLLFKLYSTIYNGKARYIHMIAKKNYRDGAWLFTDELVVN